jgi:hypothetical protein
MCFGMMQHPWDLGFGLYMTRTPAAILVWNREERANGEREKRVTPEFGERKEEKILPPNSGRYTYAEYSYNNSYQASLKMSPFEALYSRKCRTPLYWDQTGERQFFGPELIQEAEEQVRIIRENLRVAQTRQKSYADNKRRPLEFEEGDHVYLKVSLLHGMSRFKVKGKLSPHFIRPFRIFRRVGEMAYQLELPDNQSDVHNVFHVSQLKKCLRVPKEHLPMEELSVQGDLTYTEYPTKILDTLTRITRNKVIKMCKVQWSHHVEDEATWEREEELRIDFPHLFPSPS